MIRYLLALLLCFQSAYTYERTHYFLPHEPIDIVIPCAEKDTPTLELAIEGIRKNGKDVRRIIVVSARKLTKKAEWFDENKYPFTADEISQEVLCNTLSNQRPRLGWIYQQLLKLYAPFVIPGISSNVLVLDADTIFLNPVSFLGPSGEGLYNPGNEYHPPYFDHMHRLLPGLDRVFPHYSGISHHMLFQRPVLEDLLHTIESIHQVDAWKAICRCIDQEVKMMSEYEIYFNFVFTRTEQMTIRPLKWMNCVKLSKISKYKRKGYHYVSCHSYCR